MNHEESKLQQTCVAWFRAQYPQYAMLLTHPINEGSGHTQTDRRRKGELSVQLMYDVVCEGPSKQEKYVYLVYQVLRAIRQYYDNRGKVTPEQQNSLLHMSLRLEKDLDDWNTRTRFYLNQHPDSRPDDEEAFAFFQVVEQWRTDWHKYFAYKKRRDADRAEVRRLREICTTLEAEIKKYVKLKIGL